MRKILFIRKAPFSGTNGTIRYCETLFKMFCNDTELQPLAIENYPTIKSFLFHYYYKIPALAKAIKNADIVHVNGYTDMGTVQALIIAAFYKKHIVYTAHWHPFAMLRHPFRGKFFFMVFLKKIIELFVDKVVCINNEDYHFFSSFSKSIYKIPHCVEFKNVKIAKKNARMILFVGRINDSVKGFDYLYCLPEGLYEIHCVGYGNIMKKRSDIIQHVNITDNELSKLYAEASLLVVPSSYEAFSYVTIESMLHGTPAVISDKVRVADCLEGIEGYSVFIYGDRDDFVNKVRDTIGIFVDREKILERFNINTIRNQYRNIYCY